MRISDWSSDVCSSDLAARCRLVFSRTPRMTVAVRPLYIKVHDADNVAIIVNDGGLPAGAELPDGLVLREAIPQGHNVALAALAEGDPVVRSNVPVGYAANELPLGSWVNEQATPLPTAPPLDHLPLDPPSPPPTAPPT